MSSQHHVLPLVLFSQCCTELHGTALHDNALQGIYVLSSLYYRHIHYFIIKKYMCHDNYLIIEPLQIFCWTYWTFEIWRSAICSV